MSDDSAWLASLDAGSLVVVGGGGGWSGKELSARRVERVTATQIVVGDSRFRRADGRLIGGSHYHHKWLMPPTPERLEQITRARLADDIRRAVEGIAKTQIATADLEAIRAAVQPLIDEKTGAASAPGQQRNPK